MPVKADYIWMNGKFVPFADAKIHVLTHALHYGTGVFEGIRCYETQKGSAVFRLKDHIKRLFNSAKIYRMGMPYTEKQITEATKETIRKNRLKSCYIRPIAYYGFSEMGLNPAKNPLDVAIAVWSWGTYLGEEGLANGVRCKISSWCRIDSRILPPQAKATANYFNSVLAKLEALDCGYDEAIVTNLNGLIAEGPGENIFMVRDGVIHTPPASAGILFGITRDSIITIARDMGYKVFERNIPREELFIADEAFFTGTAAEVTPIREVDGRVIGSGARGPITERLQAKFFDIVKGKEPKYSHWLDKV